MHLRSLPSRGVLPLLAGLLAIPNCYLLLLLGAAFRGRGSVADSQDMGIESARRFVVLVPAHDEGEGLLPTLAALAGQEFPAQCYTVVVIADNCADDTAAVARRADVIVLERFDPDRPGKGHALHWALARVGELVPYDSVVIVDADCVASPNLLGALSAGLRAGNAAVQANYVVANPEESWSAALRYAAFIGMNTVRPLGKTHLGLSSGLLGTGMALTRELLDEVPWDAFSIVEDAEYHNKLVAAGRKVAFIADAYVSSSMPASLKGSGTQQLRWEGGRGVTLRQSAVPLLRAAIRHKDPVRLNAALEWLVPPQSLLITAQLAVAGLGLAARNRVVARVGALLAAGQVVFVLGGLLLVGAPRAVYRALLFSPLLIGQKISIYAKLLAGRTPRSFVRTERRQAVS